ncbi:MAG TPA: endonuclease/exonuclease/phosphatase family protein [Bacteroidia bacterium]|nr:endonuclease/exonuclease/phosphatase family protein [Bacteroidia bacterium]
MWRKLQKILSTTVPGFLLVAYLAIVVCYLNRWDAMVAVTLVPIWAWAAVGMVLSLLVWTVCRGVLPGVLFCLFLATAIAFSEETHGLVRQLIASIEARQAKEPEPVGKILRVATANCAGAESVLRRAAESEPDILVIQESPDKAVLDAVADRLYGAGRTVIKVGSLAVIARGESLGVMGDEAQNVLHVRLKLPDGFLIDLTNLDLKGCAPRRDQWEPAVWKELTAARIETRRLVRTHLGEHPLNRAKTGRFVCGGFGTPAGDDVFRPLEASEMIDAYAWSGQGWGNTYPTQFPYLRLDQIWVSSNLTPQKTVTRLSPESEHRIVVTEVTLPVN